MPDTKPATCIDGLPEDALLIILSKLSLAERLRLSTVCRRWQSLILSPSLLDKVTIHVEDGSRAGWLTRLRGATSWLVCRAAASMQQLSLDVDNSGAGLDREDEAEATALVAATLAALGGSGSLRQLRILMGYGMPLPLGSWLAALSSLRHLAVSGRETRFLVTGDWRGLTALQSLELDNSYVGFTDGARLPPSLTCLCLTSTNGEEPMAQQVGSLTRLQKLHLRNATYQCHQQAPLAALSSTLQSLCIDCCDNLPDCLPQMLALRTLVVMGSESGDAFYEEHGELNTRLLEATMRQLPRLECLALDVPPLRSAVVLPPGPWQRTLQQLAAPADLLECSLRELGTASRLRELCAAGIHKLEPQPIVRVLRWAAEQEAVPLRRLLLALDAVKSPIIELLQACLELKGRRPQLDIQPHELVDGTPLHALFTPSPQCT